MTKDNDSRISTLLKSIKVLREYHDLPLQGLSYLTDIDISHLLDIEEVRIIPSLDELQTILAAMNCHIDILKDSDDSRPRCLSEEFPKKRSVVLVIGNGFDIGLGMHTRYDQFLSSPFWPIRGATVTDPATKEPCYSPFAEYLHQAIQTRNDLEGIMRDFCIERYEEQKRTGLPYAHAEADHTAFKALCMSLRAYLKEEQDLFLADKERLAKARTSSSGRVLLDLIHSGDDVFVHSFNYTDIESVAYHLDVEDPELEPFEEWSDNTCWYHQMHAVLYEDNIVLGVEEDCPLPDCLSFFRKVNHPSFISSNILRDLQKADTVIFYGHSIARIDQCYFSEFFLAQSKEGLPPEKSKDILFYTYNENSWNDILTNIKSIDGVDLVRLLSNNNVVKDLTSRAE